MKGRDEECWMLQSFPKNSTVIFFPCKKLTSRMRFAKFGVILNHYFKTKMKFRLLNGDPGFPENCQVLLIDALGRRSSWNCGFFFSPPSSSFAGSCGHPWPWDSRCGSVQQRHPAGTLWTHGRSHPWAITTGSWMLLLKLETQQPSIVTTPSFLPTPSCSLLQTPPLFWWFGLSLCLSYCFLSPRLPLFSF